MRCLCPGSFDPLTRGHLDVITRAAALFDDVVVAVMTNAAKQPLFTASERVDLITQALAGHADAARIRVLAPERALLAVLARDLGARALVKGVRTGADAEHESAMATMNRHLTGVDTVLLLADPRWAHLSSSMAKEIASYGGDLSTLVPDGVAAALRARVG